MFWTVLSPRCIIHTPHVGTDLLFFFSKAQCGWTESRQSMEIKLEGERVLNWTDKISLWSSRVCNFDNQIVKFTFFLTNVCTQQPADTAVDKIKAVKSGKYSRRSYKHFQGLISASHFHVYNVWQFNKGPVLSTGGSGILSLDVMT